MCKSIGAESLRSGLRERVDKARITTAAIKELEAEVVAMKACRTKILEPVKSWMDKTETDKIVDETFGFSILRSVNATISYEGLKDYVIKNKKIPNAYKTFQLLDAIKKNLSAMVKGCKETYLSCKL